MKKATFMIVAVLIVVSLQLEASSQENDAWQAKSIPLRISKETTYLTEPLTPDGLMVDYGLYLEQRFAPKNPEDNGFRDVVRAFGREQISSKLGTPPQEGITDEYWTFLCERLRLDPSLQPTIRFRNSFRAIRETIGAEEHNGSNEAFRIFQRLETAPWTGREFPEMEKWVAESEPCFALISEALKKPAYTTIYGRSKPGGASADSEAALATIQIHRHFCRDLEVRTNYYIGMERYEDAWKDIQTLFRLARAFERMPSYTTYLSGVAFEQLALRTAVRFTVHGKLDEEQWKRFAEDFDSLVLPDSRGFPTEIARLEELSTLSGYSSFRGEVTWKDDLPPLDAREYETMPFSRTKVLTVLCETDGVDWNVMAQAVNAYFDGRQGKDVSKEFDLAAYKTVLSEASRNIADWRAMDLPERSRRLGLLYGYAMLLSDRSMKRTDLAYQAQTNRIRLAFALGRFKTETGRYPKKLEKLVERKFIAEIPLDATYSQNPPAPFGYRLLPPDGYVLYGIDPKTGDDGGEKPRNDWETRYPTNMNNRRVLIPPSDAK